MFEDQRQPPLDRAVKAMTPKHGEEAKNGYSENKPIIYGKRCKFCHGSGALWSVISREYVPCTGCQE